MNFFRRKKKPEDVQKSQNEHLLNELCTVLKTHGEAILRGKTKLTLTTPILATLNFYFQKITEGVNEACFQVANNEQEKDANVLQTVLFIFDFIQKVLSLKLTSGKVATQCPLLTLEYFKALQILEISRVNIFTIKGLHLIRRQIKSLKCFHATYAINDIVLAFGRNGEDYQTIPLLETLDISYNQVTKLSDDAFKLLPSLINLDASFNSIENADTQSILAVSVINLGYNMIHNIPIFSESTYQSLTKLIIRNNNLTSLEGLENFVSLIYLDVTANCIVDFKNISQLAALEKLCVILMMENPVSYNEGYRLRVIRSMSPMKRSAKVVIDGFALNSAELCHLGANVQPVSLTSYLNHRPLSPQNSPDINASMVSTPNQRSTPRIERRKARNAIIGDASKEHRISRDQSSCASSSTGGSIMIRSSSSMRRSAMSPASISASTSFQSLSSAGLSVHGPEFDYEYSDKEEHRHSGFNSKTSLENVSQDLSATLSNCDILSSSSISIVSTNEESSDVYQSVPMTLSKVVDQLNEGVEGDERGGTLTSVKSDEYVNQESSDGESSDDGDESVFLVESIQKDSKDAFGSADTENIFVIVKGHNLIEKSDSGKVKFKLDMHYLRGLETGPKGELSVSLYFDLIRQDSKSREYKFPEEEQFDSFLDVVQPIYVKNHQKKLAEMKYCECLKCGMVFLNRQISEEYYECPNADCRSRMVIERITNEIDVPGDGDDESDGDNSVVDECDGGGYVENKDSSFDIVVPSTKDRTTNCNGCQHTDAEKVDSSFSVVIPSHKDSKNESVSSWPPYCQRNLLLNKSINGMQPKMAKSLPSNVNFTELIPNTPSFEVLKTEKQQKTDVDIFNVYIDTTDHQDKKKKVSLDQSSTTRSYSNSPAGSYTSSTTSKSRGHSRQTSKGSIKVKTPRSSMNTPIISNQETLFENMEEFSKCNHRLKLYFDINVFAKLDEEFLCQIRCDCVGYERGTAYDSLLIITNKTVYVFLVTDPKGDTPEDCLKKLAFCPLANLKHFQCGYFAQSFIVDSNKTGFRYKFIAGNSEKTNQFISHIEDIIHSHLAYTDNIPEVVREPNPQCSSNIRFQVLKANETSEAKGKRLLRQIMDYTVPPLLKSKKMRIRTHQQCFIAKELVDWLVSRHEVDSRTEALELSQSFLDDGVIQIISKDQKFKDDEAIYKFTPVTTSVSTSSLDNISVDTMNLEDGEIDANVLVYSLVKCRVLEKETKLQHSTIVLTNSHIALLKECHQWPLSKFQPIPNQLPSQFDVKQLNKITNIVSLEFYDDEPLYARLSLVLEDTGDEETSWLIESQSKEELQKLTNAICKIWEDLYAIELTVSTQQTVLPILESYILV